VFGPKIEPLSEIRRGWQRFIFLAWHEMFAEKRYNYKGFLTNPTFKHLKTKPTSLKVQNKKEKLLILYKKVIYLQVAQ